MNLSHRKSAFDSSNRWSLAVLILFRFTFIYLVWIILPFPLSSVPFFSSLNAYYSWALISIILWFARVALHWTIPTPSYNGSGDTTFHYAEILFYIVLSVLGALIWSLLDRKRKNHCKLYQWLRLYARLYLGSALISYGASKVIPTQFPAIPLTRLVETYGNSSLMGLLWSFMGASKSYTIFTGIAEMIPGALLFFSRTTAVGALLSVPVMTNVLMLNMCYDVPVKLFSLHLLLMSLFLFLPEVAGLFNFLILKRTTTATREPALFHGKIQNGTVVLLELMALIFFSIASLQDSYRLSLHVGRGAEKAPLYGVWSVSKFLVDERLMDTSDDPNQWRFVTFEVPKSACIQWMDGKTEWVVLSSDKSTNSDRFKIYRNQKPAGEFTVQRKSSSKMEINGTHDAQKNSSGIAQAGRI